MQVQLSKGTGIVSMALLLLGLGLVGCGSEMNAVDDQAASETGAASLHYSDWTSWRQEIQGSSTLTALEVPTPCNARYSSNFGTLLWVRDSNNLLNVAQMLRSPYSAWINPWSGISNRWLSSKPGCVSLNYQQQTPYNDHVVVVGRSGTANNYYASTLRLGATHEWGVPPDAPTVYRSWEKVSSVAYSSAAAVTLYNGRLYVAGRKTDNRIGVETRVLNLQSATDPYGTASFSSTTLPALPSGWTATGDPAIASALPADGYPLVVTRATNAGTGALFETTQVLSRGVVSWKSWTQIDTSWLGVASSPSLELSSDKKRQTLYFRILNNVIWNSTRTVGQTAWPEGFSPIGSDEFADGPAAVGGELGTDPLHMVFARKTNSNNVWVNGTGIGVP